MKIKKRQIKNFLYFIFLFDLLLLPVTHFCGIPFKITYVFVVIAFITKFLQTILKKSTKIDKNVFLLTIISILTLIGWFYFANIQSITNISNTFKFIAILFLGAGGYYIAINFRFKKIYFIFPLLCCFLNLILIWMWKDYSFLDRFYHVIHIGIRNEGIWGNANLSALNANLILIFSLFGIKEIFKETSKKLPTLKILLFLIVPTFITILFTVSRSGMLCFALIIIIFYFSTFYLKRLNQKSIYSHIVFFFITIICLISVFLYAPLNKLIISTTLYEKIIFTTKSFQKVPTSAFFRMNNTYNLGIDRILSSPIIGSGVDISDTKPYNKIGFHNDYLVLWASGGILSLILYLIFIYFIIKTDLLLLPPFLFPAMTNAFLMGILSFIAICFLYSYRKNSLKRNCFFS